MGVSEILASIDREIAQLQKARELLSGAPPAPRKAVGRPRKVLAASNEPAKVEPVPAKQKRKLTPEGRKRIAEAVKRRWEKQRKAAAAQAK